MQPSNPNFCHPYLPYDIQLGFMSSLYDCIENGKVGIFESPTGTGKSLSLICGALTWLRDHKRRELDDVSLDAEGEDWLARSDKQNHLRELLQEREDLERKLAELRQAEAKREEREQTRAKKARRLEDHLEPSGNDDEFMLDDYESDDEHKQLGGTNSGLSSSTQALLNQLNGGTGQQSEDSFLDETKVIFCSRTHSQLSQFVRELRKVTPPSSTSLSTSTQDPPTETVKQLSMGSRKNLCINGKVSKLSSTQAINERCLDLQKPKAAKADKCPFLPSSDNKASVEAFRDRSLAKIRDIEEAADLGRELSICPYYASRSVIAPSEVLTLPYPLLLQKSAREALGVSVKGNVVIIDEAHNLMDAIADTFSVSMKLSQLRIATQQVMAYVQKFKNRLKGKNRVYVTQIVRLLNSVTDSLQDMSNTNKLQEFKLTAGQLMSGKGVDQIKPHKLLQYLHESKLCHKVEGYTEVQAAQSNEPQHKGLLMQFQSLLVAMMNPHTEGRFFANRDGNDIDIRYTLLDPREHFRDIVEDARAVILAGGTMSPMQDYVDYLFSYVSPDRLLAASFDHIVPKENILGISVVRSPIGLEFDFTFEKRGNERMIAELGDLLIQVCNVVPDGVVVFFPSYDYLMLVTNVWKNSTITRTLGDRKKLFEETKGVAADDLLRQYFEAIDTGKGALLLSVIGGKLSEGINFSDKLGRAVVVVGLPFPNPHGAEWKAKIQHVEKLKFEQCVDLEGLPRKQAAGKATAAGRDFYENACMRAVNQSIGRAIRHRNDYAAIMLVDKRFATDRIRQKLPKWIVGSMSVSATNDGWAEHDARLRNFFVDKQ